MPLIFVVAATDLLAGYEWSFSILYLMPLALVAWYGQRPAGALTCLLITCTWLLVDKAAGHQYSMPIIPYWNAGVRLGSYLTANYLLGVLRTQLRLEASMSRTDGLTGIMNLRAFRESAQLLLDMAARQGHATALVYIDVDDFKRINDTLGHARGDEVLQWVASTMKAHFRNTDLLCRLGGDEFAILVSDTTHAGAVRVLDNLMRLFANGCRSVQWPIGFSIGGVVFDPQAIRVEDALKVADRLMYVVKQEGKNACRVEQIKRPG